MTKEEVGKWITQHYIGLREIAAIAEHGYEYEDALHNAIAGMLDSEVLPRVRLQVADPANNPERHVSIRQFAIAFVRGAVSNDIRGAYRRAELELGAETIERAQTIRGKTKGGKRTAPPAYDFDQ